MTRRTAILASFAGALPLAAVALQVDSDARDVQKVEEVESAYVDGNADLPLASAGPHRFATPQEAFERNKRPYEGVKVHTKAGFSETSPRLFERLKDLGEAPADRIAYFAKHLPISDAVPVSQRVAVYRWDISILDVSEGPEATTTVRVRVQPLVTGVHPATFIQRCYDEAWEFDGDRLRFVSGQVPEEGVGVMFGG